MTQGQDIFASAIRSQGDLGGVFECDGEVGYFYLYDLGLPDQQRIVDSIHVLTGEVDFSESDVAIRWDGRGDRVALFVRGIQWAVFNIVTVRKFGGGYSANGTTAVPAEEMIGIG